MTLLLSFGCLWWLHLFIYLVFLDDYMTLLSHKISVIPIKKNSVNLELLPCENIFSHISENTWRFYFVNKNM